jgi:hypothetical protein
MDILNKPAVATTGEDVEMKIRGLMMDPVTNMPIIVLKDVNSDIVLPIWVGMYEANAIALEIEKSTPLRPMTHDLLRNAIRGLNAHVDKVVVSELRDARAALRLPHLRESPGARQLQAHHQRRAERQRRRAAPLARRPGR